MKATIDKKTNKPVKTYTSTRKCGDTEVIDEDQEETTEPGSEAQASKAKKPANEHLEAWETMVYPEEQLKQKPIMVDVVVMNTETQQKYVKQVPLWTLEKIPDPQMVRDKLRPENELTETFRRFLK
jgi:hypothetical protein